MTYSKDKDKNEVKADLADLALYFGSDTCDILVSDDGLDIYVSAGGAPVDGYLDVAHLVDESIVESKIEVNGYIVYNYADLDLALDYFTVDPYAY